MFHLLMSTNMFLVWFFFMKNADIDSISVLKTVLVKHYLRVFNYSGKFFKSCHFVANS